MLIGTVDTPEQPIATIAGIFLPSCESLHSQAKSRLISCRKALKIPLEIDMSALYRAGTPFYTNVAVGVKQQLDAAPRIGAVR